MWGEKRNRDSRGGQGSLDDDSSDDDDDNDNEDDDDDSTTFPKVAVIYGKTSQLTTLDNFFTAYGIDAFFVEESQIPSFDFGPYASIVVTETCNFYLSEEYIAIEQSGKKVLGMYDGGAILFGNLGLFADLASSGTYDIDRIVGSWLSSELWNTPYSVTVTAAGVATVSSLLIGARAHSTVAAPGDVTVFAEIWGQSHRGVITLEEGRYMFWGMQWDPSYYSADAFKLLANIIYYLSNS